MTASDHSQAYRPVAIALHWLVAALILSTIPVGIVMLDESLSRPVQDMLFVYHKNVGIVIFVLVVARIVYRIFHRPPPLPASVPALQRHIAHFTHLALYGLVLVMTVSGFVYVRAGGFPIEGLDALGVPPMIPLNEELSKAAQRVHVTVRIPLVVLILAHVGAAAYHGLVKRDGVFTRMAPAFRR
ncbi:cytochrome b [Pelagibacterium montanilacus]|uniref:cytochrome b n=1 Tax=Pelagibacterium montanilacus TaxID=2185280 RepID=UPI000F8EA9F3|nr:cytochrome b [Pelagibacterium montanilacus]